MIVYSGTIRDFSNDVMLGIIADRIEECFLKNNFHHHNDAEVRSYNNSLMFMNNVLTNHSNIDEDIKIAIEYTVPLTSKRVDFLITGYDKNNKENVVIIELKQWEKCLATDKDDVVITYVGKANRAVTHPCYQAYSYAKAIESFNETVRNKEIGLHPCAFCHNYSEKYIDQIKDQKYQKAIDLAPLFLQKDQLKLREFIKNYISKPDDGSILYTIEFGKIKPSIALQDAIGSLLKGNEVYTMIDEQQVAFATIKNIIEKALNTDEKHTIIVEGGPGTGKSVIAINLLAKLIMEGKNSFYVSKNSAPRSVYKKELIKNNYSKRYVENLFKGSGQFINVESNYFDCLIVDEAHRLNEKSGLFSKGENQIKEIINASKVSVFFIDEHQIVTAKDIGSIDLIKHYAKELGSILHYGDDLKLLSQFRCNGSDGYLAFLDNLLGIKETANDTLIDLNYDFRVYDDPNKLRDDLRELNKINNKCRMVAGYCYNWESKNDIKLDDINLENDFHAKWNFSTTETWAIDEDSFEQVGCIHTSQGLEFDYCGVIIGKDLIYRNNKVVTDKNARAKSDKSLSGLKKFSDPIKKADEIIKNTYRTLLSRGQKGCFIYCEDKALSNYIKSIIKQK